MLDRDNAKANIPEVTSDAILNFLTLRQHLAPHQPIQEVIARTTEEFGCCPQAISRAIEWLGIDGTRAIGRLRRSELLQLSRSVHRFWTQNLVAVPVGGA